MKTFQTPSYAFKILTGKEEQRILKDSNLKTGGHIDLCNFFASTQGVTQTK
jgi:hypothetical protein